MRDLEKLPLILYEGVESRSDGVHWIHWTRIDSTGKVYFLFVRDLEKSHRVVEGAESCSDGVHWIYWTRIDSIGDVDFLFVRDLEKSHHVVEGAESCSDGVHWDLLDTNRFHWKSIFSICERL